MGKVERALNSLRTFVSNLHCLYWTVATILIVLRKLYEKNIILN